MDIDEGLRIAAEIEDAVKDIADAMRRSPGDTGGRAARRAVQKMSSQAIHKMAVSWLLEEARAEVRAEILRKERNAERAYATRATEALPEQRDDLKHGSTNQRNGAVVRGCRCPQCEKTRQIDQEVSTQLNDRLRGVLDDYVACLRMQWTDELLSSTFSMPDGTRVLWGDATVSQHRARIEMLQKNAGANLEAAARHRLAVQEIEAAGASSLKEAVLAA